MESNYSEALSLIEKIVKALYGLIAICIVAAFGVGVFFASVNSRLLSVETNLGVLTLFVQSEMRTRLRILEQNYAADQAVKEMH